MVEFNFEKKIKLNMFNVTNVTVIFDLTIVKVNVYFVLEMI